MWERIKIALLTILAISVPVGWGIAAVINFGGGHYSGLSTDTKPTTAVIGALFNETDTGKLYTKKSATSWQEAPGGGAELPANFNFDYPYILSSEIARFCSGLVSGGTISAIGGNVVSVTSGTGFVNNHTGQSGTYKLVTWASATAVTVGDGTNYVAITSDGVVSVSLVKQDMATHVYLGHVYAAGGNTTILETFAVPEWTGHYQGRMNEFISHAIGPLVSDGLEVTEQVTPLRLSFAAGEMYARLGEYVLSSTTSFRKMYKSADIGWWGETGIGTNIVNVTQWNDTTHNFGSSLVTMTSGYWKKDLVLRVVGGNAYYVFSQAEWPTEEDALKGALPAIPSDIATDSVPIAVIVSQKSDTAIGGRIHDIRPNLARLFGFGTSSAGSSIDHGTLAGLDHDDHTQYFNQSRGDARYVLLTAMTTHESKTVSVHGFDASGNAPAQAHGNERHSAVYVVADDVASQLSTSIGTHAGITSSVHGFDASGNAPAQTHGNERHTVSYTTSSNVASQISSSLSGYATTAGVSSQISSSLSGYATTAGVSSQLSTSIGTHAGLTSSVHGFDASGNAPPQTHGSSKHDSTVSAAVASQISSSLSGYATTAGVASQLSTSIGTHAGLTSSVHGFDASGNAPPQTHGSSKHDSTVSAAVASQISTSLAGYATTAGVSSQISTSLAGYATTAGVSSQISTSIAAQKAAANGLASLGSNTLVPTAQLGTGSATASSFLAGDQAWKSIAFSALTGSVQAGQFIAPTASTLGGVKSNVCSGTDKVTAINTDGSVSCGTDQTTGGGAYGTIQQAGSSLTQRAIVNFTGGEILCADDALNSRTTCTVTESNPANGAAGAAQYSSGSGTLIGSTVRTFDTGGYPQTMAASAPTGTIAGYKEWAEQRGNQTLLAYRGPDNVVQHVHRKSLMHPFDYNKPFMAVFPAGTGSGTTAPNVLATTATSTATVGNPAPASTNYHTSLIRTTFASAATGSISAGVRGPVLGTYRGDAAGRGGFECTFNVCATSLTNTGSALFGLLGSTSWNGTNPSAQTNSLYVGKDLGQTNLYYCGNDASGTATCTSCGSNFPWGATATDACYEITISAAPNDSGVDFLVKRKDSAVTDCSGRISTSADMPAATQFLDWYAYVNNQQQATAQTLDMVGIFCQ